jgi:hypothetical protein
MDFKIKITEVTDDESDDEIQPLTRSNAVLNLEKLPLEQFNQTYEQLMKTREKFHDIIMSILRFKEVEINDETYIEENPTMFKEIMSDIIAGKITDITVLDDPKSVRKSHLYRQVRLLFDE